MEKHYDIKTQLRNKFALHMLRVDLPSDFVETTNKYIDEELIPFDENFGRVKGNSELEHSYSKGLVCLLYTSPSPRDPKTSRMPSSA